MSPRQLATLLGLAAVWGSSFMFIKVGVRELEPATLVAARIALAAVVLVPIVVVSVGAQETAGHLRAAATPLVVVGLVNSAIPFWLLSWGETRVDSGLAAILQASAPIFTALLALGFVRAERVSGARLVGLVVGFVGVALLVGVQPAGAVLGALAVLGAGFCYALAALYSVRLAGVPPLVTALGTMLAASLATVPVGLVQLPAESPGWKVWASVAVLGVVGTAIAYMLYFALLRSAGASRSILVTYLVPPMALAYGALLLDEPVGTAAIVGLGLVLAGVALGTGSVAPARVTGRTRARPSLTATRPRGEER